MIGWTLPKTVKVGGKEYKIETDYRDILSILFHLQNRNDTEAERIYIALALFYTDFGMIPKTHYREASEQMMSFIACGMEKDARPAPKLIDWEQDAPLIVADINKVAGREVRELPYLHWWTFIAYFNGIGEGQLSTVVGIRQKKAKGKALSEWEREYYRDHKEAVDFQHRQSAGEAAEIARPEAMLGI